jgi:hypothetical protein
MKPRNLFTTKTLQGAFTMVVGFAIATAPLINTFVDRKFDRKLADDIKFYLGMLCVGGGFVRTAYGRYQASDEVFTADPLPGRDKEDVEVAIYHKQQAAVTTPKIHVDSN